MRPKQSRNGPETEVTSLLRGISDRLDEIAFSISAAGLGPNREIHFLYRDHLVKMYIPYCEVDVIQRNILRHHAFYEERNLTRVSRFITGDSIVLDAGANIGNHTVFFAKICRAREVFSFEVMREAFRLLKRNIELNELSNVQLFNVGLGARKGRANLAHFGQGNIGGEITTVDALQLRQLHFMKIDVEGSHLEVLGGAQQTIRRCRPRIWVELRANQRERHGGESFMKDLGYALAMELGRNDFLFEPC
jgi:hypothetical protein